MWLVDGWALAHGLLQIIEPVSRSSCGRLPTGSSKRKALLTCALADAYTDAQRKASPTFALARDSGVGARACNRQQGGSSRARTPLLSLSLFQVCSGVLSLTRSAPGVRGIAERESERERKRGSESERERYASGVRGIADPLGRLEHLRHPGQRPSHGGGRDHSHALAGRAGGRA